MGDVIDKRNCKKWCGGLSQRLPHQVNRARKKKPGEAHGFELVDTIVKRDVLPNLWSKMAR